MDEPQLLPPNKMISIITPSYNQGNFIERTIQSVLLQNSPHLEYVVMDGGSTDNTLEILKRYADRLRYVSERDKGQSHAVNKGLQMTSGDIIGWLNSDDVYYPHAFTLVEKFFAEHPDIDVIYGQANYIDDKDQILEPYMTEAWDIERLKQICFLAQPAVFFRRRVVERFGMLNENLNYCMDYDFWLRLALGGVKFAYLPQVLAAYRLYPGTKTVSSAAKAQEESMAMLHRQLGYVPTSWLIYHSVKIVQNKTKLRMPKLSYILALFGVGVCQAFRWNGVWKGVRSVFGLPCAMVAFKRSRRSNVV